MIKSLFCQGFLRKKTELSLLYMRKISQISRKGANCSKKITKKLCDTLRLCERKMSLIHKKFSYIHCEEVFCADTSVTDNKC